MINLIPSPSIQNHPTAPQINLKNTLFVCVVGIINIAALVLSLCSIFIPLLSITCLSFISIVLLLDLLLLVITLIHFIKKQCFHVHVKDQQNTFTLLTDKDDIEKTLLLSPEPKKSEYIYPSSASTSAPFSLRLGDIIDMNQCIETCKQLRYTKVSCIGAQGEFSVSGNCLEIFPVGFFTPVRIEFGLINKQVGVISIHSCNIYIQNLYRVLKVILSAVQE